MSVRKCRSLRILDQKHDVFVLLLRERVDFGVRMLNPLFFFSDQRETECETNTAIAYSVKCRHMNMARRVRISDPTRKILNPKLKQVDPIIPYPNPNYFFKTFFFGKKISKIKTILV